MAKVIELPTFSEENRGKLTVIEKILPFEIKRVFYIYCVNDVLRGGHRHKKTIQAAICLNGKCTIHNNDGEHTENFILDSPSKCLILEPTDWHMMSGFTKDAFLLVLASEYYDTEDYIYEEY